MYKETKRGIGTRWGYSIILKIWASYHSNTTYMCCFTQNILTLRLSVGGRTDGRTDARTHGNIYSIFRDKLLLLGEHGLYWSYTLRVLGVFVSGHKFYVCDFRTKHKIITPYDHLARRIIKSTCWLCYTDEFVKSHFLDGNLNRLTAMVEYLRPLFFWASYELNNFSNFCPLSTFDS
jgi:hypothetical protein